MNTLYYEGKVPINNLWGRRNRNSTYLAYIINRWLTDRSEMARKMLPIERFMGFLGFPGCQDQASRAGVVINQGKTPQILITEEDPQEILGP